MKTIVRLALAACVLTAVGMLAAWAQQPDEDEKFQPRLPAYYSEIVDESQKDAIYAIQEKYQDQLAPLRAQIADVLKKQQAEIEAVLTPQQVAQVQKKVDEARKDREITRKLTPEQREAAEAAARKAFLDAAKKAQGGDESSVEEPKPEKANKS